MSARIAAEFALKRGRISEDQISLILSCDEIYSGRSWFEDLKSILEEGKINAEVRKYLHDFVDIVNDEEE